MKVSIRPAKANGNPCWCVDHCPPGGKRRRQFVSNKAAAEALAAQIRAGVKANGEAYRAEPAAVRSAAETALAELRAAGLSLQDIVDAAKRQAGLKERRTLAQAIQETVACRTGTNYSTKYVKGLERYLKQFARGREHVAIDTIGVEEIEQWFRARQENPSTRIGNLGCLSAMFKLAWQRGWTTQNPCERVSRVRVIRKAPKILKPDEAAKLMEEIRARFPRGLAWFALGLFSGIRPEECDKLSWDSIDLARDIVQIDAATAKVRQRRIVHLLPAAIAWLQLAKESGADLPLPNVSRRRMQRDVRGTMGWDAWPQDILRHTAASYWLASIQDAGKVAHELGNSAGILLRHYRELVSREDAAKFWAITPSKS